MTRKILVAGCGNIFLGDDAFGVEVAHRLMKEEMPEGVKVADFGIRGVHLAYELLDGYDMAIIVDATPRGESPGTVYLIEPKAEGGVRATMAQRAQAPLIDAHGMAPHEVLDLLSSLGGSVEQLFVVGCEPAEVTEGMGLSEVVEAAIPQAMQLITELVQEACKEPDAGQKGEWHGKADR